MQHVYALQLYNSRCLQPHSSLLHCILFQDVLKFGFSSREYVMLHENSKDEEQDDSGNESAPPPATVTVE